MSNPRMVKKDLLIKITYSYESIWMLKVMNNVRVQSLA
jgi:hypothetical protein